MYRWVASHRRLLFVCLIVSTFVFGIAYGYFNLPIWNVFLIMFIIFLTLFLIEIVPLQLLMRAAKTLIHECDPYPLLAEAKDQLSYNHNKKYEQILQINYCCALRYMGEYQKSLGQLKTINIHQYNRVMPIYKVGYYINLADIYLCLNDFEKAEILHNKSIELLKDLKNNKQKKMILSSIQHNAAEIMFHKQEFGKAIEILNKSSKTNICDEVCSSLLYAKIYIAQENNKEAKSKLQFVIENGNKIIEVQIAKELLSKI